MQAWGHLDMNPRAIELLQAALDLPPSGRDAYLQRACAGDAALLAEVQGWLAEDAREATPFDHGADHLAMALLTGDEARADADTADTHLQPGAIIGPWRLVRPIGSGGMGSVWLAERADGAFAQQVALKVIKLGMDSAAVLHAFERERELLVRLQHPGIAHLVDGGITADGRPWYAMRYVEGQSLGHWLGTAPSLRARLELFLALCRIVAHAHRQLIVHRDIKPGNIIVQADGTPCLLDFGIAKILASDGAEGEATVERFASAGYAAPEQMAGQPISTATDVYALGGVLFRMLTGQRYHAVHRTDSAPTRPSRAIPATLATTIPPIPPRRLRGDLDAIVVHALAPDPARRYGGADQLADDIARHLEGRPVAARPDGAWYWTWRWIGRNRLATAALAGAVLAMVGGTAFSVWQAARATDAAAHAKQEATRATAVKNYLVGLFNTGRPNEGGIAALDQPLSKALEAGAANLDRDLGTQPEMRDEIYTILVEIFDAAGRPKEAKTLAERRVADAERAFGKDDPRVAPALLLLAGVEQNQNNETASLPLLDRAQRVLDAADDQTSVARAVLDQYRGVYTYRVDDDNARAITLLQSACALLRARYADRDELPVALFQLAQVQLYVGNKAATQATLDELRQRVRARYGEHHAFLTQAAFLQARLLMVDGRPNEAATTMHGVRTELERYRGVDHQETLVASYFEIDALTAAKRFQEADTLWRTADAVRQRAWPKDDELAGVYAAVRQRIDTSLAAPAAARTAG